MAYGEDIVAQCRFCRKFFRGSSAASTDALVEDVSRAPFPHAPPPGARWAAPGVRSWPRCGIIAVHFLYATLPSTAYRCCARLLRRAHYPASLAGVVYSQWAVRSTPAYWRGQLRYAVPSLARGKRLFLRAISFW